MKAIYLLPLIIILSCDPPLKEIPCEYREVLTDKICIDFDKSREGYFIDSLEVAEKTTNYKENFRIRGNGRSTILYESDTIAMTHINELYKIVRDHSSEKYLTGIKITYGLLESGKLIRLYQLWYINNANIDDKELTGNVRYVNRLIYYHYTKNDGFVTFPAADVQKVIDNLLDNIEIRHTKNSDFSRPFYTADWTSDTESSFYSFQELFYLYGLNYRKNPDCEEFACSLIVKEGASHKRENIFWKKRFKLATIFASIRSDRKPLPPEEGDEANLGHLCPPKCSGLTYPIE